MKVDHLINCEQNLRAYQGVEDLATFPSQEAIQKYRDERKHFAAGAVSFLEGLSIKKPVSVLDIGSGSSCFLYALQDKGLLSQGVGIEISKSRHDFAQQWKMDGQYASVENIKGDVRNTSLGLNKFDFCTILDNTFTYFHPIDALMPSQVLQMANKALVTGGWLILEMSTFLNEQRLFKNTDVYYKWEELPKSNKFLYSMYRINCLVEDGIVCTDSRYIYRDQLGECRKVEYSKVYTAEDLKDMVLKAGFKEPRFYGGYKGGIYDPESSSRIVLACCKGG